jgi:hypothetical protein
MASLRDALGVSSDDPVVSLCSSTGYRLRSRWDHSDFAVSDHFGDIHPMIRIGTTDAGGITDARGISPCSRWLNEATPPDQNPPVFATDAGGILSCSRWLSEATPPDLNPPESRTLAGVPANVHASGRFFEHHFAGVSKMVSAGHSKRCAGINAEARGLEAKIAKNIVELLEE